MSAERGGAPNDATRHAAARAVRAVGPAGGRGGALLVAVALAAHVREGRPGRTGHATSASLVVTTSTVGAGAGVGGSVGGGRQPPPHAHASVVALNAHAHDAVGVPLAHVCCALEHASESAVPVVAHVHATSLTSRSECTSIAAHEYRLPAAHVTAHAPPPSAHQRSTPLHADVEVHESATSPTPVATTSADVHISYPSQRIVALPTSCKKNLAALHVYVSRQSTVATATSVAVTVACWMPLW